MPDGRGLRCFRVTVQYNGRILRPIISAVDEREAQEKASLLARRIRRVRLPWVIETQRIEAAPPEVVDVRLIHAV